jgi:hypothetical protein
MEMLCVGIVDSIVRRSATVIVLLDAKSDFIYTVNDVVILPTYVQLTKKVSYRGKIVS